jgi:transposase-like protein
MLDVALNSSGTLGDQCRIGEAAAQRDHLASGKQPGCSEFIVPEGSVRTQTTPWQRSHTSAMLDLMKIGFKKECWPRNCPHCAATVTKKRVKKTKLGYSTCFCPQCGSTFNERTGTPFNHLEFPTDIVLLAVSNIHAIHQQPGQPAGSVGGARWYNRAARSAR